MLRKKVVPIVLILLFCGLFDAAVADDSTMWWKGRWQETEPLQWGEDSQWNNPDNWFALDGRIRKPNEEDIVNLNAGTLNDPNGEIDPNIGSSNVGNNKAVALNIYLPYYQEPNASPACVMYVTDGVLEVGQDFIIGSSNRCGDSTDVFIDNGILEMMGGTITIGQKLSVGGTGGFFCQNSGKGTLNMTGGTISCGTFYIPEGNCIDANCGGTVNLDGGTIYADSLVMHPNDPNGFMYITDGKLIIDGNQISLIKEYADSNDWIQGGEPNWVIQAIYYSDMNTNPEDMDTTRVIARNPELAWTPYPKDDTVRIPPGVILGWLAGTKASDVNGHDVYFGTDEASVRDANVAVPLSVYKGRQSAATYDTAPLSLVKGTTYYWRIDEVNNPIYEGRVWNFMLDDGRAYNPYPTGTIDTIEPDLTWMPGTDSKKHDVYLGTDYSDVNDANDPNLLPIGRGRQDSNSYDPGILVLSKTYYWRIDEVNDLTIKGHVWSFTTPEYIVVEDFDSYPGYEDLQAVWHNWDDGGVNASLSVQKGSSDANLVVDGNSMKFDYDNVNYTNKYSETYANTTGADSLGMDPNLMTYGAKALMVNFYGQSNNSAQPLYVVLEDSGFNVGMATYDDGNAIQEEQWHEWNIDLDEFDACGVNLRNVQKVYLGIGVRGNTTVDGGKGDVYFEDITLAASRCLAGYGPYVDLSPIPDCYVDYEDIEVLFDAWPVKGYDVNAAGSIPYDPCIWYKFDETSGPNAIDFMHPGNSWYTAIYMCDPCDDPCDFPINRIWDSNGHEGGCIVFDANYAMRNSGYWFRVTQDANQITISAWVKGVVREDDVWQTLFHAKKQSNAADYWMVGQWREETDLSLGLFADEEAAPEDDRDHIIWEGAEDVPEWTHFAFVKNIDADEMIMYVDGMPVAMTTTNPNQHMDGDMVETFYIGGPADRELTADDFDYDGSYLTGSVDDFQIYGVALSHPEILKLAERESVHVSVAPLFLPGEPYVDDKIDLKDFAVVARYWLEVPLWP